MGTSNGDLGAHLGGYMAAEREIGWLAGNAMAQAMYPYTFGIVSDYNGVEGRGLGTGVGIVWRGNFLIATAKHVIEDTAPQRLYYLLPQQTLQIPESSASATQPRGLTLWGQTTLQCRHMPLDVSV